MCALLALFVTVPLIELTLLLQVGEHLGFFPTLALVIVTGIVGATLARSQGWRVWNDAEREMQGGRLPADALIDGMILLVAGALLVTPGILTDIVGFSCLVPTLRLKLREHLRTRFQAAAEEGRAAFTMHVGGFPVPPNMDGSGDGNPRVRDPRVIDVEARTLGDEPPPPDTSRHSTD